MDRSTEVESKFDQFFDAAHLRRDLGRRAVQGAALTVTTQGIRFVLEGIRIVVLARLLTPADYGLVAMVTLITGLIAMFQDLGLNIATVTREKISHAQVSTLFWVNLGFGIVLGAATCAVAPVLSWFYGEARLVPITLVLAPTLVAAGLAVQHKAILRRQMRFVAINGISILSTSSGVIAALWMASLGAGYWALVGMSIVSVATDALASWIAVPWRPGRPVRGVGVRELVRFGGNVTGTNLLGYLSRSIDALVLGWWWGAVPLGLYTKAQSLVETPINRAWVPVGMVILPSLSRLGDDPERYRAAYLRLLEKLALVLMPASLLLALSAEWLIPFLLGSRWVDAAPIFGMLALIGFVRPMEGSNWWLFVTQNRAGEAFRWSLVSTAFTVAALAFGLRFGAVGVAGAIAAAHFVRTPVVIWYMTRRGPVRASDIYRTVAAPALASAGAALALLVFSAQVAERNTLVLSGGLLVAGAACVAILCVLPAGRRALRDAWSSARLLRKRSA